MAFELCLCEIKNFRFDSINIYKLQTTFLWMAHGNKIHGSENRTLLKEIISTTTTNMYRQAIYRSGTVQCNKRFFN